MLKSKMLSTDDEFLLGICFQDPVLMSYLFWTKDLTIEGNDYPQLSKEQLVMFTDISQRQLFATGRKLAKSVKVEVYIVMKALNEPKTEGVIEGLITTPRQSQMNILHGRIANRIKQLPIISSLITKDTSGDKPELHFRNGFIWYWRIEGAAGKDTNMQGIRAKHILGDEQQESGWMCHNSRKMSAMPGCTWLYCGVPNGVRGTPFYSLDRTEAGATWSRHKYPSFINPIYDDPEERSKLINSFGGASSPDYLTQVLGEWGEEAVSSFPPGSIAIDQSRVPWVKEYLGEDIRPYVISKTIGSLMNIPVARCYQWAAGIDYGIVSDPTVFIAATRPSITSPWYEYFRLTLHGLELPYEVEVFKYIMATFFEGTLIGISSDHADLVESLKIGIGIDDPRSAQVFYFRAGGKTQTGTEVYINEWNKTETRVTYTGNKQIVTDTLRSWMINAQHGLDQPHLWLADDQELIDELAATTERKTPGGAVVYTGASRFGKRSEIMDHNTDALRYLVYSILTGTTVVDENFSEVELVNALGWAGDAPAGGWKAPWE